MLLLLACAPAPAPTETGPTWYRDVRPIVDQNCARCHADDGYAQSFDDPLVAADLADAMVGYVDAGTMPPPAPDPGCRDYEDADRYHLADEDAAVIRAWAEAGAPVGDPADAPPPPTPTTLAPWDLELRPPEAYTPDFSTDTNDYRCFRLDLHNDEPVFLTGMEALIDDPRIVHHVVVFSAPRGVGADRVEDPTRGFPCGGFGEDGWDFVTGWAPGSDPVVMPEGMGIEVETNAHLVLQMHYFDAGPETAGASDQSGYGLRIAESVDRNVYVYPLGTYDFTIPADDADYETSLVIPWMDGWPAIEILGVFPHMHQLGRGFDMSVFRADGEEDCLVRLNAWDYHNQVTVAYPEAVPVSAGDALSLACRYDNSAQNPNQFNDPPQDVYWGEGTDEEMCFGFTYGTLAE